MITYDKFILLQKKYDFDLSPCGVCPGNETGGYFCTPVGMTVIGSAGVDGPTAIYISRPARTAGVRTDNGGNDTQNIGWHIACSTVRFEPADSIDWKLEFREKLREDISVTLS